jgi:hypothetical protein
VSCPTLPIIYPYVTLWLLNGHTPTRLIVQAATAREAP